MKLIFFFVKENSFILFLIGFISINLIGYNIHPTVWTDEVAYIDPAVNLYLKNSFSSSIWYVQNESKFWAGNVPLFQFIAFFWLKIFGFSLLSVRVFGYALITSAIILINYTANKYQIFKNKNIQIKWIIILFTGYGISYSFRCIRPDSLTILLFILGVHSIISNKKYLKFLVGFLAPFAGLQLVAFFALISGTYLIFYRKKIKDFIIIGLGILLGICILLVLYNHFDVLKDFQKSVLPHVKTNSRELSFFSRLWNIVQIWPYRMISDLSIRPLIIAFVFLFLFDKNLAKKNYYFAIILTFIIPFGMLFLGKYEQYYTWMLFLPFSFILFYQLDKSEDINKIKMNGILFISMLSIVVGLPTKLFLYGFEYKNRTHNLVDTFVEKHKLKIKNKQIYCDPHLYYPLKELASKMYIYYSLNYMNQTELDSIKVVILNPDFIEINKDEVFDKLGGKERWIKTDSIRVQTKFNKGAIKYNTDLYELKNK